MKVKDFVKNNVDFILELATNYMVKIICHGNEDEFFSFIVLKLYQGQSIDKEDLRENGFCISYIDVCPDETIVHIKLINK